MDKQIFTQNTTIRPTHERKPFIRLAVVFIAGIAVGALTILSLQGDNSEQVLVTAGNIASTTTPANNPNPLKTRTGVLTTGTTISASTNIFADNSKSGAASVTNQAPGNTVFVQSVTVPPPGVWIAVREISGKELGNVLGAQRVHGPLSNITVTLLRDTKPNKTYAIELYRPGAKGSGFDPKANSVYIDFDTGKSVIVPFTTNVMNVPSTGTDITQ